MAEWFSGKFDSPRDAVLHAMATQGWCNESSGEVDSPTHWFARVSNERAELVEIEQAFSDDVYLVGVEFDWDAIIGHYLVTEDSQGFAYVTQYDNEADLIAAFRALDATYSEWIGDDND